MVSEKIEWPGWETVGLIGRGSFGAVYEIQRSIFGDVEKAALKVISIPQNASDVEEMYSDGYDDESITATFQSHLKSIVAEYSLMRKMNGSANVVNCDDVRYVQHDDGIGWDIFIKMELLTPLTKALPGEVSEDTVIQIGKDICNALVLCKKHEIVHRDIKPQNIFVSPNGDYKLGDFGIAKTVEKTMGGTKIGTYKYMAPEVYNNQPYGSSADIYSLGLVLYWLLNERRMPFMPPPPAKLKAGLDEEARYRRLSGEPLPPPVHGNDELKRIVLKACAYDPKERFASAAEMLEALNKLNCGASVVAPIGVTNVDQSDDLTTGTVFRGGQKENDSKADELEADATVGPIFGQEKVAEQTDAASAESSRAATPRTSAQKDKKSGILKYILIAIGVIAVIVILLQLRSCNRTQSDMKETFSPTESTTESTTEENLPLQQEWSEWSDSLPEYVSADNYDIEEKTLYSSRTLETTSSTEKNTMDGWELFDTVEANGEFGPWSDWSASQVDASATREVETQARYRYRDKETTTGTSSSMTGWELYDTTYSWGDYGSWSSWSATSVSNSDSRQVETKTMYRYRSKEITTGSSANMSGWTLYDTTYSWGSYGSWSDWSTNAASSSDSRKVETKTQYRYRDITYTTEYTNWGSWSSWQDDAVSADDYTKVETRDAYRWYCYYCSSCGASMPYTSGASYSECYTSLGGCGKSGSSYRTSGYGIIYLSSAPSDGTWAVYNKRYVVADGQKWYISSGDSAVLQYRYATRSTQQVTNYGSWSSWGDTAYSNSSTREVQTRTVYRYCDRSQVATYHFYRWGSWSDWSNNEVTATNDRQVETGTFYQYRDRSQLATYHFYRWGNWSDWSTEKISATNDRQVEDTTYYRYRDRVSTTTYYFRRWTDWTEYSDGVVTPSDTVEVQTKTQYRYKSKES